MHEVAAGAVRVDVDVTTLIQTRDGGERDVQAVVQQTLRETTHETLEARRPALQRVGLHAGNDIGTELQIPRQRLLQASEEVPLPAVVAGVDLLASQVDVVDAAVQHQACVLRHEPVHKGGERRVAHLHDVAIGLLEHIVGEEAVLRDLVVREYLMQGDVQHELLRERAVAGTNVVRLLYIEVGVTIGDDGGKSAINIGIQIGDARTRQTHVVGKPDVLRGLRREAQRKARHEVAIVVAEVAASTLQIAHLLERVLVAQTGLRTDDAHAGLIFGIGGSDVVVVLILHEAALRLQVGMLHEAVLGPRTVVAHDVLSTEAEHMAVRKRTCVVHLQRLLERLGLVLREEVVTLIVVVELLCGLLLRRIRHQVGEDEVVAAVGREEMLPVGAGGNGSVAQARGHIITIC